MVVRVLTILLLICAQGVSVQADVSEIKASYRFGNSSIIQVISNTNTQSVAKKATDSLRETYEELSTLLGEEVPVSTTIHILDEKAFFKVTGAPKWANALFIGNRILIPVPEDGVDIESIKRSARHEFTHAILNKAAGSLLPGYIDEGLAQWMEGKPLPVLNQILLKWLKKNDPISLSLLQGGFTRLSTEKVAPAYAQSLYAVQLLLRDHGFGAFEVFFKSLKRGMSKNDAFKSAFKQSEKEFEKRLFSELREFGKR